MNAAEWAYEEYGEGFPLLLGTSYLWDARMWRPQIEVLSRCHRVIIPLLPGHGNDAALPPQIATPAQLAASIGTLLDAIGVKEYAVAGLSVGGMWAAELALQHPQRVRALLLMDTFLGAEPDDTRQRYFGLLDAIEQAGRIPPGLIEQIVPLFFRPAIAPDDPLRLQFAQTLREWPGPRIAALVALGRLIFARPDRLQALAALDATRTLVAVGADDVPRPPHEASAMADIIGCAVEIIADAGHIASLENPEAVTALLQAWLRKTL